MFTISFLLILFILSFKLLSSYIKTIRTGDPNETNLTYWMFSYDFKSQNKEWVPENKKLLERGHPFLLNKESDIGIVNGVMNAVIVHGKPIGETKDNLASAVAGETHEYTDMYPGMAKTAREEGFEEIADWFATLAKAEKSHAGKFQKTLETIK